MNHIVGILDDTAANRKIQLVGSPVLEGMVTECMNDFRLVGLGSWGSSGYLVGINLYLVGSNDSWDNDSGEVLS
jgi:hypothetical protein